jgi:transportin-3
MELIPKLVDEPQLRYTATLIIGRYSDWLARPPQNAVFLGPLLSYVVTGLNDKEVASSAALAFKFVCEGCAKQLCTPPFIENLFSVTPLHSAPSKH